MKRLEFADRLRVAATAAVVIVHAAGYGIFRFGKIPLAASYSALAIDACLRWCVPVFVMLSGALLLGKVEPIGNFYKKRLKRIAIPTLFWTAFYLWWWAYRNGQDHDFRQRFLMVLEGLPYYHLHFLFIIAGLYVITPLLRPFAVTAPHEDKRTISCGLLTLSSLGVMAMRFFKHGKLNVFTRFFPYMGYFMMGNVLKDSKAKPVHFLFFAAMSGLIFFCEKFLLERWGYWEEQSTLPANYLSPLVIVQAICAFLLIKELPLDFPEVADASFGIYLIHPCILDLLHEHLLDFYMTATFPTIFAEAGLSFFLSFYIVKLMNKFKPLTYLI